MEQKISLVIVEDNELMLFGISSTLSKYNDLIITGTAANGKAGLETILEKKPDVALVDIRMPKMNGIELTKAVNESGLDTKVVIITSLEEDEWLFKAFLNGANAYTLKDIPPEELYQTIKMVAGGLTLIQPTIAKHLLNEISRKEKATPAAQTHETLTERELEILQLIAKGYKNRQIAETLFIAEGTVKIHNNNILRKLGVADRTQAVLKAMENKLL